jgi:fructosamine-3-kinase
MFDPLADVLSSRLGGRWQLQPLGSSAFCSTWRAIGSGAPLFVKSLPAVRADVLEAEADGLAALAATDTVRVPAIVDTGCDDEHGLAWLALEWLQLVAPDAGFGAHFGGALGALHRADLPGPRDRFGWHRGNRLGATPQPNDWSDSGGVAGWCAFNASQRIGAMRERLQAAGRLDAALQAAIEAVVASMPQWFDDGYTPRPSLIHGDLWSGNWGMLADGTPVVFDPAVSCSDAEAELAMMELFGAPPATFWPAYSAAAGLHPGYPRRRPLYQLYHLLNHALLFGGGYARQALGVARRLMDSRGARRGWWGVL